MENPNWSQIYKPEANLNIRGNPALDDLRQTYHAREQQRIQDNADLTKEMAKLNFNGSRDTNHPELQQQFGDIVKKFGEIRGINDPKQRGARDLELRQLQNQFMYSVEESKQRGLKEQKLLELFHHPGVETRDGADKDVIALTKIKDPKEWDKKYQEIAGNIIQPKSDPIKDAQEIVKSVSGNTTTTSQRYNKDTGRMENVSHTATYIPKDKFISAWVAMHNNTPSKIKNAIAETGIQDPAEAVLAQGEKMYEMMGGGKSSEKVTGAGMTIENVKKLQTHSAQLRQQYPSGTANQETPFQKHASLIQHTAQESPKAAESLVKPLIEQIPTKGLQGKIKYEIKDGTLAIDIPDKYTGGKNIIEGHPIRIDLSDPHWGDVLQAKLHQEGMDISSFNQAYKGKQLPVPGQAQKTYRISAGKYKGQSIPSDKVHEKAVKAGVSDREYLDWLSKQ